MKLPSLTGVSPLTRPDLAGRGAPSLAGYPPLLTWLGYPYLDLAGVPRKLPGWGTAGNEPGTSDWGTPRNDMEPVEVLWDGDGVPPV